MAGFTAQGVVDPLDYDFNPYVKARGVIPEPTDNQIAEFLRDIRDIIKSAEKEGMTADDLPADDPASLLQALDDMDPDAVVKLMESMCEAYSKLCSGTPTAKQIHDLPMRVRQVFFNWLQGEVMAPEAATGGGQAQVTPLRGARAG